VEVPDSFGLAHVGQGELGVEVDCALEVLHRLLEFVDTKVNSSGLFGVKPVRVPRGEGSSKLT